MREDVSDQNLQLVKKLKSRLGQAYNIAQAAETCLKEGFGDRTIRLMEEIEELTRDAGYLVAASMVLREPIGGEEGIKEIP